MIRIGNTEIDPAAGEGASPTEAAKAATATTAPTAATAKAAATTALATATAPAEEGSVAECSPAEDSSEAGVLDTEAEAEASPDGVIPLDGDEAELTGDGEDGVEGALSEGTLPEGAEALRRVADALSRERTQMALERELSVLRERFPELKELGDVVRLKRYPEIKGMVGRGYSLSDAVRLAYEDVYLARRANAAALQARTNAFSSSHLHPARPIGEGRSEVTETQIREYLEAIPGATRDQAIAAYRKWGNHRR